MTRACPFCLPETPPERRRQDQSGGQRPAARVVAESDLCLALRDLHPVSPGHTLVITRRHVATYFDASAAEQAALWQLVTRVKDALDRDCRPDGYNVGFNAGAAAGQTVMHVHVHVIPRYRDDMADPQGGVRGVIPARQKYGTRANEEP